MPNYYYKSEDWKWIREQVWKRHGRLCWACGTTEDGQYDCHHQSYQHFGLGNWEELQDVVLLCRPCHIKESKRLGHGEFKRTNTNEYKEIPPKKEDWLKITREYNHEEQAEINEIIEEIEDYFEWD